MIDIKLIRTNPEILDESLARRGLEAQSKQILKIDQELRELQQTIDANRHTLKSNSTAQISDQQKAANKELGEEIWKLQTQYDSLHEQLHELLSTLPNLVSANTPKGLTEDDNVVIRTWQSDRQLAIQNPQTHDIVAGKLLDKEAGSRIAGSRLAVLHGPLAKLARVLAYWFMDQNTQAGYQETAVPFIMNDTVAYGMGVLPKFAEDLFATTTNQYLIPTGEASLVGMFMEQKIPLESLPLKLTALTPCFRSEAGSAGKDTAGLIRMHQFQKVEIVGFTTPEQVDTEHQALVAHVEGLLQKLGLSYRVLAMCAGDLGFHAHEKYDIEVFMPGLNKFLEVSSCSQCSDFQSRRLKLKTKPLPHTINGSSLPIDRIIAAILENYQTDNGVAIPQVLQSYYGDDKIDI